MKTPVRSLIGNVARPLARVGLVMAGAALTLILTMAPSPAVVAAETNGVERPEETGKKKVFNFEGGSPIDFIAALDRHFRTRLVQILTLPETLRGTRVPKLRVPAEDPREVLSLYNRLQSPALGQWRFEPESTKADTNMNVLMLVPDKDSTAKLEAKPTRVKALALAGIPEKQWPKLVDGITEAAAYGEKVASEPTFGPSSPRRDFSGMVRVQRESKILVVIGSESYLEIAESYLNALRTNAEIEAKALAEKEEKKEADAK